MFMILFKQLQSAYELLERPVIIKIFMSVFYSKVVDRYHENGHCVFSDSQEE